MPLSLGELIAEGEFGLTMVSGKPSALRRHIVGAHAIEVADPARWLSNGWVMLTTGLGYQTERQQRALVDSLESAGIAALGFGVGVSFDTVPEALQHAAQLRAFPLFIVPYPTAFRDIVRYVDAALVSRDVYTLRRVATVQNALLGCLSSASPEEALLSELIAVRHAPAYLFTPGGELESITPDGSAADIWKAVREMRQGENQVLVGTQRLRVAPIMLDGFVYRWLVCAATAQDAESFEGEAIFKGAQRLFEAVAALRRQAAIGERLKKAHLLDAVLEPSTDLGEVQRGLESYGIDFEKECLAVTIAPIAKQDEKTRLEMTSVIGQEMERLLSLARLPSLVVEHNGRVKALVQQLTLSQLETWTKEFEANGVTLRMGVSRPFRDSESVIDSFRDADIALNELEMNRQGVPAVSTADAISITHLLIRQCPPHVLQTSAESALRAIRSKSTLHEALIAYFECDLNVSKAAALLHLHPNSLRYRLERIESLTGSSLQKVSTISDLYIALSAEGLSPS